MKKRADRFHHNCGTIGSFLILEAIIYRRVGHVVACDQRFVYRHLRQEGADVVYKQIALYGGFIIGEKIRVIFIGIRLVRERQTQNIVHAIVGLDLFPFSDLQRKRRVHDLGNKINIMR